MAKADEHKERAVRLVESLRKHKEEGTYPTTAAHLRQQIEPGCTDEELLKALQHRSQSATWVLANKKDPATPVALADDIEQLAGSALLLRYALGQLASADKPLHPVPKIVARVDASLRPAFEAALQKQLTDNTLPAGVGQQSVKGRPYLYLEQFPPPPPRLPRQSPARLLAEVLLTCLRQAWTEGKSILDLNELTALAAPHWQGELSPGLLRKALQEDIFSNNAIVVRLSRTQGLVALAVQRDELAGSPRLLIELLRSRSTPRKAFLDESQLLAELPESVQSGLQARLARLPLPAGVTCRQEGDKRLFALEEHLGLAVRLGDKVQAMLQQCRQSGSGYPASLADMVRAVAPETTPEQLAEILADREFRSRFVWSLPFDAEAPIALPGDEKLLASSPLVIERAVRQVSTREHPLQPASVVARQLDRAIRADFIPGLVERINARTVPPGVVVHDIKGKIYLRVAEYEPPPPPPPAERILAEQLLQRLRECQQAGGTEYPTTLGRLLAQVSPEAKDKVVRAALATDAARQGILVAIPGLADSPVALAGDHDRLLDYPGLLELLLQQQCTADNQAVTLADLARKLSREMAEPFVTRIEALAESNRLPERVGTLRMKGKRLLFFKS